MLQLYAGSKRSISLSACSACVVCQHFLMMPPEARSNLQHAGRTEQYVEMLLVSNSQRHTLPPLILVWL